MCLPLCKVCFENLPQVGLKTEKRDLYIEEELKIGQGITHQSSKEHMSC